MATDIVKKPIDSGIVGLVAGGFKAVRNGARRLLGAGTVSPTSAMGEGFMAPGEPLQPQAPQIAGRRFDYPVGYNISIAPRSTEAITFTQLRNLADSYDLLRLVIETRKDQLQKLRWSFTKRMKPGERRKQKLAADSRVDALEAFFRYPDRVMSWDDWLRELLEELFVIDAPTIYKRRNRGGGLFGLEIMDGATIKPILNDDGRTPLPPEPAYSQVIKGIPAVQYDLDELIYAPRNRRVWKIYGYSPVEQIIMTVNIALRRQISSLQYYTEGNIPEALIGVPDNWSPDQIKEFQSYWDALLEGQTAQRRHAKFIPGQIAQNYVATKAMEVELKAEFDEWLARIVCFAFSIPPTPFVKMMNRATAETAMKEAKEEGILPLMQWVKGIVDRVVERDFGITDLEFIWEDDGKTDALVAAQAEDIRIRNGTISIDEAREDLGRDPVNMPNVIFGDAKTLEDIKNPPEPPPGLAPPGSPGAAKPGDKTAKPGDRSGGDTGDDDDDDEGDGEVGKAAGVPFVKGSTRIFPPVRRGRREVRAAVKRLTAKIAPILKQLGQDLAANIRRKHLPAAEKASLPPDSIIGDSDFGNWAILINPIKEETAAIAESSGMKAAKTIGFDDTNITNQVHEDALDYADQRAAELVGMRIAPDGRVIPNPNAEWAITDSTRESLKSLVGTAVEEGWSSDRLADEIENSEAFSRSRANMIARTELALANSEGAMIGYRATGMVTGKVWLTADDDDVSEECRENEAAGTIPLDEKFPSGDYAPPVHPNCRCDIAAVIDDGE